MVTILEWRRGFAIAALVCGLALLATPASARQALAGHVPPAARNLAPLRPLEDTNRLHLAISLPLRNADQLKQLVDDLYNPRSPNFRRYLTPQEFAQRFGPTAADYAAVKSFMEKNGFTVTATHPNRAVLNVAGPVTAVNATLHTRLQKYRHPAENRDFFAPDSEPSLDLATPILSIHGLNNLNRPHPLSRRAPLNQAAGVAPNAGTGAGGQYQGTDFRKIYAPGVALTGTDQTVALLQWDGYFTNDIVKYSQATGVEPVPQEVVLFDGFDGTPGVNNAEVALDIQMAMSMAPGLAKIIVYEGDFNNTSALTLLNRIATDNSASQVSCSWTWNTYETGTDQAFLQMAAQGQSFFTASGDSDAYVGDVAAPADNPYITVVGGTTLMTSSQQAWLAEKVWNNGANYGSGGGISTRYPLPSWQSGINMDANGGSTSFRNLPDVAMVGDRVLNVADNGTSYTTTGTSIAAPLWAAFTALINEQAAANGQGPMGFMNPALYALGKSARALKGFHDVTTDGNYSSSSPYDYYATAGYDLCTGWGTPTGSNTINLLLQIAHGQADHFVCAASTNAPTTNFPFTVTLTARTISNTAAAFNGTALLTAAQVQTNLLFGRDFETSLLLDWGNEGGPFTWSIDAATGAAGTSHSLLLSGGDGSNSYNGISHSLPAISPNWFEFYVRTTTTTNAGGFVVAGQSKYRTNSVFHFHLDSNGQMGLYDAVANWYPAPYAANQWYKIGLQLDWTNKVVHYYVDDTLVFANIPFCNSSLTNLLVMNLYNIDSMQTSYDQFRLTLPVNTAAILAPTAPVQFTNGVWEGPITVNTLATNVILTASDSAGHEGASAPLNLQTPPPVTLTVDASPAGAGSATGGGNLISGTRQTIQALPAAGWGFVQWQDGDPQNPRLVIVPATNSTYTAIFLPLPQFTSQPASQIVDPGASATFTVTATGPAPIYYYWQRNGLALGGATNTSVVVTNIAAADSGALFACLASNRAGVVASQSARLSVRPVLNAQGLKLANQTLTLPLSGTPGSNYTLQTSTDFTNWTTLTTFKLITSQTNYLDTNQTSPWRFYRLLGTP